MAKLIGSSATIHGAGHSWLKEWNRERQIRFIKVMTLQNTHWITYQGIDQQRCHQALNLTTNRPTQTGYRGWLHFPWRRFHYLHQHRSRKLQRPKDPRVLQELRVQQVHVHVHGLVQELLAQAVVKRKKKRWVYRYSTMSIQSLALHTWVSKIWT